MKRLSCVVVGVVVACTIAGCGGHTHESAAKDALKMMSELADILDTVKDEKTAKAAAPKIEKIAERMEELKKAVDKLPKLSKEEQEKLGKTFEEDAKKILPKFIKATAESAKNAKADPDFVKAMKRLDAAGKGLDKDK